MADNMKDTIPEDVDLVYLLVDSWGQLTDVCFGEQEAEAVSADRPEKLELVEWPIAPLKPLGPDHGYQVLSSDSAELGKLGSMDVLLRIEIAVRVDDGWEVVSILPGQFGQQVYPPCVTAVFRRAKDA